MFTLSGHQDLEKLNNIERKKYGQKLRIIRHLYREKAKPNMDLCASLNMSAPTSIGLLNELIVDGLIEKRGRGKSAGGRKPDLYRLRDNSLFVLSVQIENLRTKIVLVDLNNNFITPVHTYQAAITRDLSALQLLYKHAFDLIDTSGINIDKLIGIGISMPGLISSKEGVNHTYLRTNEASQTLKQLLEDKFQKPVYIQNDVKTATLAERRFGLAYGKKDVLVLSMDWGIGLGIIIDGKLRIGTSGFAGEFGHIPIIEEGTLCHCGKRGCLETVASGMALAKMAQEGIQSGQHSILQKTAAHKNSPITYQDVIEAANKGDQFAINLLSETGISLGKGIAILIQLFNPEMVILSGKIAEAKQYITTPIQQSINSYCMTQLREKTAIVLSDLGENAGLMGAVATVMDHIFENHI